MSTEFERYLDRRIDAMSKAEVAADALSLLRAKDALIKQMEEALRESEHAMGLVISDVKWRSANNDVWPALTAAHKAARRALNEDQT